MQGNITFAAADLIQSGVVDRYIGLIRDEELPRLQVRRKKEPIKLIFTMISIIFDTDIFYHLF